MSYAIKECGMLGCGMFTGMWNVDLQNTVIVLIINIGIDAYFAYSYWYFKKKILLVLSLLLVLNGIAFIKLLFEQRHDQSQKR